MKNDITLLKFEKEAVLNEKVQIACLSKSASNIYPLPRTQAYAVGWGRTTPRPGTDAKELMNTMLTVLNDTACRLNEIGNEFFPESKFCATDLTNMNKSICNGQFHSLKTSHLLQGHFFFTFINLTFRGLWRITLCQREL